MKKSVRNLLLMGAASVALSASMAVSLYYKEVSSSGFIADVYGLGIVFVLSFSMCGLPILLIGALVFAFQSAAEDGERRAKAAGMSVKEHRKKIMQESKLTFKESITRWVVRILIGFLVAAISLGLKELLRP